MDYVLLFTCTKVFMYSAFIDENGNVLLTMIKLSPNTFSSFPVIHEVDNIDIYVLL